MKLWGGRFSRDTDERLLAFGDSLPFDRRLWAEDIKGSVAHARMLGDCGIIPKQEADQLVKGLTDLAADFEAGKLSFSGAEDIHSLIESLLVERLGAVGKKLHTGRSRNDQVALDIRLFVRGACAERRREILEAIEALLEVADANREAVLPGYTHLQRAQPILLAHHLLAHTEALWRDWERFGDCAGRAGISPLGAGALAGAGFRLDREQVARELGLAGVTGNSLDAVSDRDMVVEFVFASALTQTHLSRLAEELVLWSTTEFGFVEFDEGFSTGSSIMPQKRNPDGAELIRGKTGRVIGDLVTLLTVLKGLPLAYNKDLQEDKEALFDAADTIGGCLRLLPPMLRSLRWNYPRMRQAAVEGFLNATDLADYLVRKGMPFREAHGVVGRLVRTAVERGISLTDLPLSDLQAASPLIGEDAYAALSLEACLASKDVAGGTAPARVGGALAAARDRLARARGAENA
ncbi:MAG: argininosuccinate lyase [Bacteroidota bacterium]